MSTAATSTVIRSPGGEAGGPTVGVVPAARWLRGYRLPELRADVVAGLTLAAYLLPAGIGDASLAGLPPEAGLYACMFAGLMFWLFCSSQRTAITVTSAISLLIGTSIAPLAAGDAGRASALAACTALMVAGLALLAWVLRAGSLVSFISETVLIGFKIGVALTLASTQLPKLFGISPGHSGFFGNVGHFASHLGDTNGAALAVGLCALAVLILGRVFLRNRPVALLVVVGAILAGALLSLETRGVKLLGDVPRGLPVPGLPSVSRADLNELLPLAMACFLLAAVETTAIGRMFAAKHGGRLDSNQEFLAIAGANLAAGLGRGFPVSGGMSQSLVNESGGARTPVSGLVAAMVVLAVVVWFSDLLHTLPQPALAAIILMAVIGLVNVKAVLHLWQTDRGELLIAGAALGGVLASGLLRGVLIGAVISLLMLIRRASRPHVAFLGRIPGARRYSDLARHPDNEPTPGVLIFRPEGALVYFNAEHVHDTVMARLHGVAQPVHTVICDLSASPHVDVAGAEMLKGLDTELRGLGARMQVVEARSSVRDKLRLEGLEDQIGRIDRFTTVADAVEVCTQERAPVRASDSAAPSAYTAALTQRSHELCSPVQ